MFVILYELSNNLTSFAPSKASWITMFHYNQPVNGHLHTIQYIVNLQTALTIFHTHHHYRFQLHGSMLPTMDNRIPNFDSDQNPRNNLQNWSPLPIGWMVSWRPCHEETWFQISWTPIWSEKLKHPTTLLHQHPLVPKIADEIALA